MDNGKITQIISQIRSLADDLEQCCSGDSQEESGEGDTGEGQSSSQPMSGDTGGGSKMAMAMAAMKKK